MHSSIPPIALLGVGFFPEPGAGDKNFYLSLLPHLGPALTDLTVFSLNDRPGTRSLDIGAPARLHGMARPLHLRRERFFRELPGGRTFYRHQHRQPREMLEKSAALLRHLPLLRREIRARGIRLVHCLDNFGPAMPALRHLGVKTSLAAVTWQPPAGRLGARLYEHLQLGFFDGIDAVVTWSRAYGALLESRGVPQHKLRVIPWGVDTQRHRPLSEEDRASVRRGLGIGPQEVLFLWTGFIQQVREADFWATVDAARQLRSRRPEARFLFLFKPEIFAPRFTRAAAPGIEVRAGGADFPQVLGAADYLLSPVGAAQSTAAPPLTWIEAMSRGVPVITTAIAGADELITPEQDGFLARSYEDLVPAMTRALLHPQRDQLAAAARIAIGHGYELGQIAGAYEDFFTELCADEPR